MSSHIFIPYLKEHAIYIKNRRRAIKKAISSINSFNKRNTIHPPIQHNYNPEYETLGVLLKVVNNAIKRKSYTIEQFVQIQLPERTPFINIPSRCNMLECGSQTEERRSQTDGMITASLSECGSQTDGMITASLSECGIQTDGMITPTFNTEQLINASNECAKINTDLNSLREDFVQFSSSFKNEINSLIGYIQSSPVSNSSSSMSTQTEDCSTVASVREPRFIKYPLPGYEFIRPSKEIETIDYIADIVAHGNKLYCVNNKGLGVIYEYDRDKYDKYNAVAKFCVDFYEAGGKFDYEYEDKIFVYYDIETYWLNSAQHGVPTYHENNKSRLGMICLDIRKASSRDKIALVLNEDMIPSSMCLENVDVEEYETENAMAARFVEIINELAQNQLVYLIGFNSNQKFANHGKDANYNHNDIGYDLPWILSRVNSSYRIYSNVSYARINGLGHQTTTHVNIFSANVKLLDASLILLITENDNQRGGIIADHLDSHSLDSWCNAYKIKGKENFGLNYAEIAHIMRTREKVRCYGIEHVVKYCLEDCSLLHTLVHKSQYFERCKSLSSMFRVPINLSLFGYTNARLENIYFAHVHRKAKIPFEFKLELYDLKKQSTFKGAITYSALNREFSALPSIPVEQRRWVMFFDFVSQYPNAIISQNIGRDSYIGMTDTLDNVPIDCNWIPNDPDFNVVIDGVKHTTFSPQLALEYNKLHPDNPIDLENPRIHYVLFSKKILPSVQELRNIFDRRMEVKDELKKYRGNNLSPEDEAMKQKLTVSLQSLKNLLNTFYGVNGSASSYYLYHNISAICVAHMARISLAFAVHVAQSRNHVIAFADTDSVGVCIDVNADTDELKSSYTEAIRNEFIKYARAHNRETFGDVLRFNFEYERTYSYFMSPKNKSYITQCDGKWGVKGIQLRRYEQAVRPCIQNIIIDLAKTSPDNRCDLLRNFIHNELELIKKDPRIYCSSIKMGSKAPALKTILEKYPQLQNEMIDKINYVIKKKGASRSRMSERYIPLQCLTDLSEMDPLETFRKCFQSNICRYWGSLYNTVMREFDCNYKHMETETLFNGYECYKTGYSIIKQKGRAREYLTVESEEEILKLIDAEYSVHEILDEPTIRLAFDIDGETSNIGYILNYVAKLLSTHGFDYIKPYICASTKGSKSCHLIYPIIVYREHASAIAYALKDYGADPVIYSYRHSLRLPLCDKYNGDIRIHRQFLYEKSEELTRQFFSQFLLTNEFDEYGKRLPMIKSYYGMPNVYDEPMYNISLNDKDFETLKFTFGPNFKYTNNSNGDRGIIIYPWGSPCLACNYTHKNQNVKILRNSSGLHMFCFGNSTSVTLDESKTKESCEQVIKKYVAKYTPAKVSPITSKYVDFEIKDENINFVKSSLGSGKTHQLIKYLDTIPSNLAVILLSSRRAYSNDMTNRMNSLYFENYLDIKQQDINLTQYTRLIIQIDSIGRIKEFHRKPYILVLDEIESIQVQLKSTGDRHPHLYSNYCSIIRCAKTIIAMDGLLNQWSQEHLLRTSPIDKIHIVKYNTYPEQGRRINASWANKTDPYTRFLLAKDVNNSIEKYGSVVCPCASKKITIEIARYCSSMGKKVIFFHGDDISLVQGKTMREYKKQAFNNINEFIENEKCDLLIYTHTITSGVSIDVPFDYLYCIIGEWSNPVCSYQAKARVRNIKCKESRLIILSNGKIKYKRDYMIEVEDTVDIVRSNLYAFSHYYNQLLYGGYRLYTDWLYEDGGEIIYSSIQCAEGKEGIKKKRLQLHVEEIENYRNPILPSYVSMFKKIDKDDKKYPIAHEYVNIEHTRVKYTIGKLCRFWGADDNIEKQCKLLNEHKALEDYYKKILSNRKHLYAMQESRKIETFAEEQRISELIRRCAIILTAPDSNDMGLNLETMLSSFELIIKKTTNHEKGRVSLARATESMPIDLLTKHSHDLYIETKSKILIVKAMLKHIKNDTLQLSPNVISDLRIAFSNCPHDVYSSLVKKKKKEEDNNGYIITKLKGFMAKNDIKYVDKGRHKIDGIQTRILEISNKI